MGFFDFFKRKNKPPKQAKKTKTVTYNAGLSLSGGGTRGIAHIGAIRAFEENGIVFSCVAGTSAGSIIGALYSAGYNSYEIEHFARGLKESDLVNSRVFFIPSRSSNLENVMRKHIGDMSFSDLKTPFAAVAVDVISGEEIVLTQGSVAKAVSASSAVPGIFTPVEWPPYRLIDGGLHNTIPSDVARSLGAEKVVAVDINSTRGSGTQSTRILDILKATFNIAMKSTALKGIMNSDIIVTPDLTKFKSTKIDGFDQMLEIGYKSTMEKMEDIKALLGIKKPPVKLLPAAPDGKAPEAQPVLQDDSEPFTQEWFDRIEPAEEPKKKGKEKKEKKKGGE